MNLHWQVIITQSPQFTFRFTVDVCSMGLDKCVVTCIHHYSATQRIFTAPKILCALHSSIPPALWQPLVLLLSPWFCLFQNATVEIIQYVSMWRVFTLSMESLHNKSQTNQVVSSEYHCMVLLFLSGQLEGCIHAMIQSSPDPHYEFPISIFSPLYTFQFVLKYFFS